MRKIIQTVSWAAIIATVLPAFLFLAGSIELKNMKLAMLIATIAWFVTAPFWMERSEK